MPVTLNNPPLGLELSPSCDGRHIIARDTSVLGPQYQAFGPPCRRFFLYDAVTGAQLHPAPAARAEACFNLSHGLDLLQQTPSHLVGSVYVISLDDLGGRVEVSYEVSPSDIVQAGFDTHIEEAVALSLQNVAAKLVARLREALHDCPALYEAVGQACPGVGCHITVRARYQGLPIVNAEATAYKPDHTSQPAVSIAVTQPGGECDPEVVAVPVEGVDGVVCGFVSHTYDKPQTQRAHYDLAPWLLHRLASLSFVPSTGPLAGTIAAGVANGPHADDLMIHAIDAELRHRGLLPPYITVVPSQQHLFGFSIIASTQFLQHVGVIDISWLSMSMRLYNAAGTGFSTVSLHPTHTEIPMSGEGVLHVMGDRRCLRHTPALDARWRALARGEAERMRLCPSAAAAAPKLAMLLELADLEVAGGNPAAAVRFLHLAKSVAAAF